MITSALITECRQKYGDIKKSMEVKKAGDGITTLFNTGYFPVVESSYTVYKGTSAQTQTTHYSFDLDNGDVLFTTAPGSSLDVKTTFKYAHWRDNDWLMAINGGIQELNARGFFKQIVRNTSIMSVSANVRAMSGPSACIDIYEVFKFDDKTISGGYQKLPGNWSYQQDANKILLSWLPSSSEKLSISYLRNLQTYSATSATLDVTKEWLELVRKWAGAAFYEYMAGKIAKQGNASIDEGHFSFTNCRTMSRDLRGDFDIIARRTKPTRPAKDIAFHIDGYSSS